MIVGPVWAILTFPCARILLKHQLVVAAGFVCANLFHIRENTECFTSDTGSILAIIGTNIVENE